MEEQDKIQNEIDNLEIQVPEIKEDPKVDEVKETDAAKQLPETDKKLDKPEEVEGGDEKGGDAREETPNGDEPGAEKIEEEKKDVDKDPEDTVDAKVQNDLPPADDTNGDEIPPEKVDDTPALDENDPSKDGLDDIEKIKAEYEALKFQVETEKLNNNFQGIVKQQQQEFNKFLNYLADEINKEFAKYGIPSVEDPEELRESDPGKYEIANNILTNAKQYADAMQARLQQPVVEAANAIIARSAGNEIDKYNLTDEQKEEACQTFLAIYNQDGLRDMDEDLKVKVQLAVGRAKMIHPDTPAKMDVPQKVTEEPKAAEEPPKEQAKPVEQPKPVKKDLDAYTEGVNPGAVAKGAPVNEDNVNEIFFSLDGKEKLAFFAKYKDLLMKNNRPMPYTDR